MSIVPRHDWGAAHGQGAPDPGPEPRVVIHHSYRPALNPSASVSQEKAAVRGIETYHVESNGWDGIGYNFLVAPSGRTYEGRGWKHRGAHAGPVNGDSIGVCLLIDGNVMDPTPACIQAVRELVRLGLELGEISPRYTLSGHRDHMAGRTCPGERVYRRLQEFRHDAGSMPQPGERRWSGYYGEWLVLTRYEDDLTWWYVRESWLERQGQKAQTPWSKMPLRRPNP